MTSLDNLIIEFRAELNLDGYGNAEWEDDSYQHMFDVVTCTQTDDSFSFADRLAVLDLMNDTHISLREAYFNALNFLENCTREENTYKLTLAIYPIADCGEDLSKGEPLEVSYEGTDLNVMKLAIDNTIIAVMKELNANDGETFVEMDIEHNGEYYDHDEQTIFVDLQNNRIQYGI